MPQIQLGEWLPDRSQIASPGLTTVVNFLPTADGWDALADVEDTPLTALPSECRGVYSARTQAGINLVLAGTDIEIYEAVASDFVNITRAAGDYVLSPSSHWEFEVYGEARFGTNGVDPVQYSSGPGVLFIDMADGDASLAKSMAIVEEFLVLANIVGQGANSGIINTQEAGLHWSAQGDPTLWPTIGTQAAIDNQSDFQILHGDGGPITDVVAAAEYTAVFRKRQTYRMDYVGAPAFFVFRKVDNSRGATVPGTAIAVGNFVYFLSEEGFLRFNGARTEAIGIEKVDRTIKSIINWEDAEAHCSVAHYPKHHSIVWCIPLNFFNRRLLFGYNYELEKWWFVLLAAERVFVLPSRSLVHSMDDAVDGFGDWGMDEIDPGPGTLEDVNMDSLGVGTSTIRELAIFNTMHAVSTFTSTDKMNGTIVTGDYEMPGGRRALIRGVRPTYGGNGNITVQVGGRFNSEAFTNYGPAHPVNGNGVAPARSGGRYQQAVFQTSGFISQLTGFDYILGRMGKR